ncbi:MAG: cysteine synthase [Gammaproteobacteria bacterium BRH_c0]|nr:MAG: cysteine synthase [Gammaproteobacteria bacterium BRH_c0]
MTMSSIRKTYIKSIGGAIVMFAFAIFVMPPLYDLFCEVTGIGGKTSGRYEADIAGVDESRTVRVQFVATNNAEMDWDFKPTVFEVKVHPGQPTPVTFYAKNTTDRDMVAQAIPNVVPNNAAQYFHKTECFCFNQQPLTAGEEAELPLVFIVDKDLPRTVNTITLSYTLFDVTDRFAGKVVQLN